MEENKPTLVEVMIGIAIISLVLAVFVPFLIRARAAKDAKATYSTEFLFEKDGIKVYRFYDNGYPRYFSDKGSTSYETPYGKGQSYQDGVK